jgi:hypothetical protein
MDDVHVFSTPEGRGIRYVVLADLRNPIPAGKGPVMQLEIAADADAPPGARGGLFARITLASDVNGDSVVLCDHRLIDPAPIALCVAGDGGQCDVNGDGRGDVRDLVLMTRCFDLVLTPPDSARVCPDCDGDTAFTLSDLLCCARDILRAPLVPRDSVRSDARVSVSFDPVEVVGSNLIVPVRVRGLRELGAAVLRLSYPGNRWRAIAQIALPAGLGPVDWYPIVDVSEPGSIHLGGLRLGDAGPDEFTFVLAMEPLPVTYLDHPPGIDRLETVGADLAARDGSVITPKAGLPSIVLDLDATPRGALELSSPRPNPFGTSTTFFVRLPEAGLVDLAVHDIAGRRIATIAHSTYEAGEHPFTWDGDGARDGVYFVRLTVNGQVLTSRVAMLRESR